MKKEKDTKKGGRHRKAKEEEKKDVEEDDGNQINYHPKLDKCEEFLNSALTMIV